MNSDLAKERRKQERLEKLGTNTPRCGMCGETDYRCIELHHVAGRKYDDAVVGICYNCHRKVSDDQIDHPRYDPDADAMLASIGHFLLGLADLLVVIVEKLMAFGQDLLERSTLGHDGAHP